MPFSFSVLDETKTDKLHCEFFQDVTVTHFPPGKPHLTYSTECRIYGINQPTFAFNTETYQGDISQKDLTAFLEQAGRLPIRALKTKTEGPEHTTGTIYLGPQLYSVYAPPNEPIRKEWQTFLDAFLKTNAPISQRKTITTAEVGDLSEPETITFQTLLKNPARYDGKRIKLTGYYHKEMECSSFAETKTDIRNYSKALWLAGSSTFANPKNIASSNNITITAEGTFHLGPGGHMGLWMGELRRPTILKPAEDRDKNSHRQSPGITLLMIDSTPTIRLTGLKNVAKVEEHFASSLVDIAYLDTAGETSADVLLKPKPAGSKKSGVDHGNSALNSDRMRRSPRSNRFH